MISDNSNDYVVIEEPELAYVSADGSFGTNPLIIFKVDTLTESEWEHLSDLGDNDKYEYVYNLLEKGNA